MKKRGREGMNERMEEIRGKNGVWRRDSKSSGIRWAWVVCAVSVSHWEIWGVLCLIKKQEEERNMGCFVPLSEANVAPVCPCVCTEPLSSVRRFILDHVVQRCSAASPREAHYESFMPAALTCAACIFNERLLHFINRALKNSNRIDPGWEAPELDCIFAVSPVPLPAAVSLWGLIDTVIPLSSFFSFNQLIRSITASFCVW